MQVEGFDTTVLNYINEIKKDYEHQIHKLQSEVINYQNKYLEMKERFDLLVYQRYARSAERLPVDEKQQLLFAEEPEQETQIQADTSADEKQEIKSYTRKKPGRKPIDPNLPRRENIIDIPEAEKTCACGSQMTKIGEETSEKVEIIPPSMYVLKTIRPKYACRSCEGTEDEEKPAVRIAPVPPAIIPRSIASASLLSYVMIQKYQDHLPFYRQEVQFQRIGIEISRQDMSNWQQQIYGKLKPLYELLKETLKSGPVIQMDETEVQVMGEEGRSDTQKSYMWLALGGPPNKPVVLYEYRRTHDAKQAKEILSGYSGYLQTDGYKAYDTAVKGNSGIIQVGCFAHARRKFFEASKSTTKPQSAEEGIKHIRKLYHLEDELRDKSLDEEVFLSERKARAGPILEQFKRWLEKRAIEVLPSSLLGKAVGYSLGQWDKMIAYLESHYLTPDNNACENAIRPFVLGRKNWLFNKSPEGAESSCGMFSLIETSKQNGLEPLLYLRELFEKAPRVIYDDASTHEDWEKLLSWNIFTA